MNEEKVLRQLALLNGYLRELINMRRYSKWRKSKYEIINNI